MDKQLLKYYIMKSGGNEEMYCKEFWNEQIYMLLKCEEIIAF